MVTLAQIRELAMALPEVQEKPAWGTPGFYVANKLFARAREDGLTLSISFPKEERAAYIAADPKTFPDIPHFREYDSLAINIQRIKKAELGELLRRAWLLRAPKRLAEGLQAEA